MDKIINKLKVIFYTVLIFVVSINVVVATEVSRPEQVSTDARDIILNLFKIIDGLFIVLSLFFIVSILRYFFYVIKKEDQKKIKSKKILFGSFVLFFLVVILKIMIFITSYVP